MKTISIIIINYAFGYSKAFIPQDNVGARKFEDVSAAGVEKETLVAGVEEMLAAGVEETLLAPPIEEAMVATIETGEFIEGTTAICLTLSQATKDSTTSACAFIGTLLINAAAGGYTSGIVTHALEF